MSRLSNLKEKLEGSLFKTSRYGALQILKYQDAKNVEVVFLNTGYTTIVQMNNIYKGKVKDKDKRLSKKSSGKVVLHFFAPHQ